MTARAMMSARMYPASDSKIKDSSFGRLIVSGY
jgi:hypothetical protein